MSWRLGTGVRYAISIIVGIDVKGTDFVVILSNTFLSEF